MRFFTITGCGLPLAACLLRCNGLEWAVAAGIATDATTIVRARPPRGRQSPRGQPVPRQRRTRAATNGDSARGHSCARQCVHGNVESTSVTRRGRVAHAERVRNEKTGQTEIQDCGNPGATSAHVPEAPRREWPHRRGDPGGTRHLSATMKDAQENAGSQSFVTVRVADPDLVRDLRDQKVKFAGAVQTTWATASSNGSSWRARTPWHPMCGAGSRRIGRGLAVPRGETRSRGSRSPTGQSGSACSPRARHACCIAVRGASGASPTQMPAEGERRAASPRAGWQPRRPRAVRGVRDVSVHVGWRLRAGCPPFGKWRTMTRERHRGSQTYASCCLPLD